MKTKSFIFCCTAVILLGSSFENLNAQWQTSGNNIYYNVGNVGIGTSTILNYESWNKVLDIFGSQHAKLLVRSTNVKTGIFSHESWNGTVGRVGTESSHDLRLMAGYGTDVMTLKTNGNVGIGTTAPAHKLDVSGNIRATGTVRANEVIVTSGGADFVFDSDYRLRPLEEVEQFIIENKHLPEISPASEMIQNGVNMGEFQIQLLQKIEELTLYIIDLKKEIEELKK